MPLLTNELRASAEAGHATYLHAYLPHRPLLVGVLPHAFCNPKIAGCGFCTFPHEYMQAHKRPLPLWNRYFDFDSQAFRLLYATRQLSKLTIQFNAYRELLGTDALADFADEWQVLARHQLVEIDDAGIRLTARGMFFSDTVASVLAHRYRATQLERSVSTRQFLEGNQSGHM
jgi:hypothetical protein